MPVEPWFSYPAEMNATRHEAGAGPSGWLASSGGWISMGVGAAAALGTFFAQKADLAVQVFGVSSLKQLAAAAGYGGWLATMHGLADVQAASEAAAAAAYAEAKASMVPSEAVFANRAAYPPACASLLGPADPKAVALALQYVEMCAQNGATMTAYDTATTGATIYKGYPPPPPLVTSIPGEQSAQTAMQTAQELASKNGVSGKPADMMTKILPQALQALTQAGQMPAQFVQQMTQQLTQMFQPVQQVMSQLMSPMGGALGNGLGTGSSGLGSSVPQGRGSGAPLRGGLPLGSGGTGALGGFGSRLAAGGAGGGITGEMAKPTSTAVRSGPSFAGIPLEKVGAVQSSGAGGMGGGVPPRRHRDKRSGGTEYRGGDHVYRAKSRDENQNLANAEEDALFD
ncbi:PPE domain-containing protein [Mycobacteroides abscessus]|uniref:PPE domain-containing protein n=1 Tax=Mycobacteroides abscessus TaxID=36809 RepID=UPI000928DD65|nr:PPE domain-containing protein [Mycobacteroides abscessus]SHQ51053.1 PPE-repeat containing protein [Mycobacteroides abscessus subsp. abscessus]SKQ82912.1 PPE-repeat containing protein [Mycobacteroides abscessus subsp. massiliense]SLC50246.1 PPE-repeat containing protein [Mycobacteroides abscessus subsp. massiliense]